MTIMCTQLCIVAGSGLDSNRIVFFADRMISVNGRFHSRKRKVFEIPYLNAGIGYYGIGGLTVGTQTIYLEDRIRAFISNNSAAQSIGQFAHAWLDEARTIIPADLRQDMATGFHIAGFNSEGLPEFWHIYNHEGFDDFSYKKILRDYKGPVEPFLSEYGPQQFGYDSSHRSFSVSGIFTLRNGDIRAHALSWEQLDKMISSMQSFPDFRKTTTDAEHEEEIRFRMDIIGKLYKKFCESQHVGAGCDVFTLRPNAAG